MPPGPGTIPAWPDPRELWAVEVTQSRTSLEAGAAPPVPGGGLWDVTLCTSDPAPACRAAWGAGAGPGVPREHWAEQGLKAQATGRREGRGRVGQQGEAAAHRLGMEPRRKGRRPGQLLWPPTVAWRVSWALRRGAGRVPAQGGAGKIEQQQPSCPGQGAGPAEMVATPFLWGCTLRAQWLPETTDSTKCSLSYAVSCAYTPLMIFDLFKLKHFVASFSLVYPSCQHRHSCTLVSKIWALLHKIWAT